MLYLGEDSEDFHRIDAREGILEIAITRCGNEAFLKVLNAVALLVVQIFLVIRFPGLPLPGTLFLRQRSRLAFFVKCPVMSDRVMALIRPIGSRFLLETPIAASNVKDIAIIFIQRNQS